MSGERDQARGTGATAMADETKIEARAAEIIALRSETRMAPLEKGLEQAIERAESLLLDSYETAISALSDSLDYDDPPPEVRAAVDSIDQGVMMAIACDVLVSRCIRAVAARRSASTCNAGDASILCGRLRGSPALVRLGLVQGLADAGHMDIVRHFAGDGHPGVRRFVSEALVEELDR